LYDIVLHVLLQGDIIYVFCIVTNVYTTLLCKELLY